MNNIFKTNEPKGKKRTMALSAIIIIFTVIFDQITKIIALNYLKDSSDITAIPGILGFSYVENKGAAFGIFSDNRWIFMVFSTIAIIAMVYFLATLKKQSLIYIVSLSFLVGGGIGNMIDRIARGYVIDFFKFLFVKFAVFNVADCFVTVGAVLLAIYLLFYFDDDSIESKKTSLEAEEKTCEALNDTEREDNNE